MSYEKPEGNKYYNTLSPEVYLLSICTEDHPMGGKMKRVKTLRDLRNKE